MPRKLISTKNLPKMPPHLCRKCSRTVQLSIISRNYYRFFCVFRFTDDKMKIWRDPELMWAKDPPTGMVFRTLGRLGLLEKEKNLLKFSRANNVARNTATGLDGKLNSRCFTDTDSPLKNDTKIVEDENLDEKRTGTKSASTSPYSFARIRQTDDRPYVHQLGPDRTSKFSKTKVEDKFTTIDDFDENSIDDDRLVAVNARLRILGEFDFNFAYF